MSNFRSLGFIFVFLIAVTLASFLGFKLYVDYQIKKKVDVVVQALWSVAKIEYEHVNVELDGRVTLTGVRVRPFEIDDEIMIQSVAFFVPDLEYLLNSESALASGLLPEEATMFISGMEIDVAGALLGRSKRDVLATESAESLCLGDDTKYSMLSELGYDRLRMDMVLGFTFDKMKSVMNIVLKGQDKNIAKYDIELALQLPTARDLAAGRLAALRLVKARLNYVDEGYHQRMLSYCPAKLGLTRAQFLDKKVHQHGVVGIPGLVLGKGLREGYRKFLEPEGRINIAVNPAIPLNPAEMIVYTPAEIIDSLSLAVVVNDEVIRDLSVSLESTGVPHGQGKGAVTAPFLGSVASLRNLAQQALGGEIPAQPAGKARNAQKSQVARYVAIDIGELSRYQGRIVRVLTVTGFVRSGRLDEVVGDEIIVTWSVGRGEMAAYVPIDKIKGVDLIVWD